VLKEKDIFIHIFIYTSIHKFVVLLYYYVYVACAYVNTLRSRCAYMHMPL